MQTALALAATARWHCPPNPAVACILVGHDGHVLGEGVTQHTGGPHAEIMALRSARERGHAVEGATAYVTLEPCAHFGRTPPCADALVAAGLRRVVVAVKDPNPQVCGRGIERLRAAGIQVDVGLLRTAARDLNLGFFSRMIRRRPWVRTKIAMSIDAKTALNSGASQWITSAPAREDGHRFRAQAGAIVTGIGTILADDPRLDLRLPGVERQPWRVVIDSRLRTPHQARILQSPGKVRLYTAVQEPAWDRAWLSHPDVTLRHMPAQGPDTAVDLARVLTDLAEAEVNEVHLEAGATLNGAMLGADLIDELLIYMAPCLLGPGRGMADMPPLTSLTSKQPLRWLAHDTVGPDLRLRAIVGEHDQF